MIRLNLFDQSCEENKGALVYINPDQVIYCEDDNGVNTHIYMRDNNYVKVVGDITHIAIALGTK